MSNHKSYSQIISEMAHKVSHLAESDLSLTTEQATTVEFYSVVSSAWDKLESSAGNICSTYNVDFSTLMIDMWNEMVLLDNATQSKYLN